MLVIPLFGGLGNQLFQLCYGFRLSDEIDRKVKYSGVALNRTSSSGPSRRFVTVGLLEDDELISVPYSLFRFLGILRLIVPSLWIRTEDLSADLSSPPGKETLICSGYFQSLHNAEYGWSELSRRMQNAGEWRGCFGETQSQIAVHIRLGDYRSNPATRKIHGVLTPGYFQRGIQYLAAKTGLERVCIVSDEPTIAREFIGPAITRSFNVRILDRSTDMTDFAVLCTSAAIVGSNSSFSWWGSYVASRHHSATVVMPRPWYAEQELNEASFFDPAWYLASRETPYGP